jgi:hypothetical protein
MNERSGIFALAAGLCLVALAALLVALAAPDPGPGPYTLRGHRWPGRRGLHGRDLPLPDRAVRGGRRRRGGRRKSWM